MSLLEEIQGYIQFEDRDAAALRCFLPRAESQFPTMVDVFYERVLAHPGAHLAIAGGDAQVHRLKTTLVDWLKTGMQGPHDDAYFKRRARIGRVHVLIGLPQRYMVTGMTVIRLQLQQLAREVYQNDAAKLAHLSDAIDRWLDMELVIMLHTYKEDSDQRLTRRERLASVGQLAASIAHELRNPLGVIESSLYLLRRRLPEDEVAQRHFDKIHKQVAASGAIITKLLEMARARPLNAEHLNLSSVMEEAAALAVVPKNVRIDYGFDPQFSICGDRRLLTHAFSNVFTNALAALESHADPVIEVEAALNNGEVTITIRDNGPGFAQDVLPTVFEPLVSTRSTGFGLGLPLVKTICERHGGVVRVKNLDRGGAAVTLTLPSEPPTPDHEKSEVES